MVQLNHHPHLLRTVGFIAATYHNRMRERRDDETTKGSKQRKVVCKRITLTLGAPEMAQRSRHNWRQTLNARLYMMTTRSISSSRCSKTTNKQMRSLSPLLAYLLTLLGLVTSKLAARLD